MRIRTPFVALTGIVLAAALSGCSGQQLASEFCGGPPPTNTWNPVVPQLLYPVPGWSKVPDNAPELVVAYNLSNGQPKTIVITPTGGALIPLGPLEAPPNPLPTPNAKEQKPGTTMWGVALPPLHAHTTYTVGYHFTNSYCGRSETFTTSMGSFTTQ
jgi:hypothetical protein